MVTVAKSLDVPIKLMFPRPGNPNDPDSRPSHAMLGLGDVVLPGIVIGLALRFDLYLFYLRRQKRVPATSAHGAETIKKAEYFPLSGRWSDYFWTHSLLGQPLWTEDDNKPESPFTFPKTYFTASLVGYVLGLLATLGVMMIWDHAQPALLYLVPGVLTSVWLTAAVRGELGLIWNYTEAIEEEEEDEKNKHKGDKVSNGTGSEESHRVTRSQSRATEDVAAESENDDGSSRPRSSKRSRPEREIFSFTIEAPPSLKKSKANKKHARSSTVEEPNTVVASSRRNGRSKVTQPVSEPAGKRQKLW